MALKFNIYYKTDLSEPWILANNTPIDHDIEGNEFTVSGLKPDTRYYLTVVPGILDDNNNFVPYLNQAIGPTDFGVTDINDAQLCTIQSKTRINTKENTVLGNSFTVA